MTLSKKTLIIVIFLLMLLVVSGWYVLINPQSGDAPTISETTEDYQEKIPEGWKLYEDEELGFSLAYPIDWELLPYNSPGILQGNRIWLQKGPARILIDPRGSSGALEFPNPVEKKNIIINEVSWQYIFWPEQNYHRFTDINQTLTPRTDLVVGGDNGFRVHVHLKDITNEEERQNIVTIVIKIIETLKLI